MPGELRVKLCAAGSAHRKRVCGVRPQISALARMGRAGGGASDELSVDQLDGIIKALHRQGFEGDEFVVALPQKKLLSGVLEVPPRTSGAPLDVICRNELARTHKLEAEQIESVWWELPPPPVGARAEAEGAQAIAVGCKITDAEELLGVFEAVGVGVTAIDARGSALARAVSARLVETPGLTAVLEWEWESGLIVVVRGGVIVYERHLAEAGLKAIHAEMVKKLSIDADAAAHVIEQVGLGAAMGELSEDPELIGQAQRVITEQVDSLVLEVRASAAYAGRRFGGAVGRVIMCGDGACIPEAAARLERRMEMPRRSRIWPLWCRMRSNR